MLIRKNVFDLGKPKKSWKATVVKKYERTYEHRRETYVKS